MVGARSCLVATVLLLAGCQQGELAPGGADCSSLDRTDCDPGLMCEQVGEDDAACFTQHVLRGRVLDADDMSVIAGASVVARDASGSAVSRVVTTDARGVYLLRVPVPRNRDGSARKTRYTLGANAAGYRAVAPVFALPEVDSSVADIALLPVEGNGPSPWLGPGVREPEHETLAAILPPGANPEG
jgi:hypothetical protein